ncbi:MAG: thioredoxin domain-containing protein [Candidatus Parcubacteria bacterium]|nr:thioredoxin domain-containing protein [Candidatus Parcubacteria bacterium]
MKKFLILFLLILILLPLTTNAAIMDTVRGMILLQVEANGEAWYVNPADSSRYYMKDGTVAYQMMRNFGLGIVDFDLNKIPAVTDTTAMKISTGVCASNSMANRLKGKIVLQVEQHGEAWYIYPKTCQRIYMKDGAAAYEIMRFLGLGISNINLALVPLAKTASSEFTTCLQSKKYLDKVNADLALGKSLGVEATPTSFLNSNKYLGALDLTTWESIVKLSEQTNPGQPVVIQTFADFQCYFCNRQAGVFDELIAKHNNVSLDFHHFPLFIHAQAENAALAAECGREQGKFKEMHDALFALTAAEKMSYENILKAAAELGL